MRCIQGRRAWDFERRRKNRCCIQRIRAALECEIVEFISECCERLQIGYYQTKLRQI